MVGAKVYSIQFEGYKSFPSGIENEVEISPYVSVLIGKNNCGKSSCLDALECVFEPHYYLTEGKLFTRVSPSFVLDKDRVGYGFSEHRGGGDVPDTIGSNHYTYGSQFIGKKIVTDMTVTTSGRDCYTTLTLNRKQHDLKLPEGQKEWETVVRAYNDFQLEIRFLYKGIIIKHNKTEPTYTKTSLFLCEKRRFLWPGLRKEGNLFKLAGPGGLAFFHLTKKEVSKWPMKK